jgi:hypothetical protein
MIHEYELRKNSKLRLDHTVESDMQSRSMDVCDASKVLTTTVVQRIHATMKNIWPTQSNPDSTLRVDSHT